MTTTPKSTALQAAPIPDAPRWPDVVARLAGGYAVAAGVAALAGWTFDVPRLTDWPNDGISMFPNTAMCALASGLALLLHGAGGPRRTARVLSIFVAVVGGLTLLEHVTTVDFGIDRLLFAEREWGQAAAAAPMRMGPPASLSFLLVGIALALLDGGTRGRRASAAVGVTVAAIAALSLSGRIYGAEQMYSLPRLTAIAAQTATTIVMLGIGLMARVPEREPMRAILERGAAGMLARRALPFIIVIPIALGWLRVVLQQHGLVDLAFGTALRSLIEVALLTALLWSAVGMLRTHEQALDETEAELRRQAVELAAFLDEREEANRRKDEFIAILAHELRNPLAPVRNAAYVLKRAGAAVPDLQRPIEMIERQVAQMSRLIDDLLDVSRISRGALGVRRSRVSCADVVDAAVESCRDELEAKGHRLELAVPPEPIFLLADRERLVQVLGNLLGNAAKYTPPSGRIALAVRVDGDVLEVTVRDDGVGIPPEKLGEIFELFARVDPSFERQGGLGIGLTLVRQLVELHGGTVEARSRGLGHGSEFVVRLPVVVSAPSPAVAPSDAGLASTPRRILVADDNRDAVESLKLLLEMNGHDVHTAFDGEAAITCAERLLPEVALVDIGMPKANGYEVARRIREHPWGKGIYLVALTGWGQEDDKRRAREAGFDAHLVKPVPPTTLDRLLATMRDPVGS